MFHRCHARRRAGAWARRSRGHARSRQTMRPRVVERRPPRGARRRARPQSAARTGVERRVSKPAHHDWLALHHGDAPLMVSFPHTGTEIPSDIEAKLVSPWLGRKDADYWV